MNVMDLKGLVNRPKRNGFDLSERTAFTAKVGELLPVMTKEVIPGDKFKINLKSFTRTVPVNTAAYTRIKEYYDFYFVPNRLLWNRFDQFITQMPNSQHSKGFGQPDNSVIQQLPYATMGDLLDVCWFDHTQYKNWTNNETGDPTEQRKQHENIFGYDAGLLSAKLLEYLGYSNAHDIIFDRDNNPVYDADIAVNLFPILAYQKIYQDYFRNDQWEISRPDFYNLDFIGSTTSKRLYLQNISCKDSFLTLRYANWKKDLFTGLLPKAQFSEESSFAYVASLNGEIPYRFASNGDQSKAYADAGNLSMYNGMLQDSGRTGQQKNIDTIRLYTEQMGKLSVLALRQAEAMQKWNEIAQANKYDYKHQIEAHWNVKVPDVRSGLCEYLGGTGSVIDIDGIDNTNITARETDKDSINKANIAGKGQGASQGFIDYEAKEHGILMCIYHAVPELDYVQYGLSPLNTKIHPQDYAIPELDSVGMQAVPMHQLNIDPSLFADEGFNDANLPFLTLGYAPRYYDYKISCDYVKGGFINVFSDWVAPISRQYMIDYFSKTYLSTGKYLSYVWFKVNPNILQPIFGIDVDGSVTTDQFLTNAAFDIKVVRNLDYNGLPY